MKKFAVVAVIPLVAGFLCAQSQSTQTTETKTTTTTWNGTLVDANCYTTHTEHKETTSNSANRETTTTTTKTETNTECPVTTTTTSFGLLTPTGQYVHFDQPSNTRIVEVVKGNKKWTKYMEDRQPLKVTVVGEPSGDVVVMRSIK
jgi:hypothetical protein